MSISGCLFVADGGIRFYIAPIPTSGRDRREARKWITTGKQSWGCVCLCVCVCVCVCGGGEGRKEIPRVQCHLTSSDLSLQAAIGLLSYLAILRVWSLGFQREDRCVSEHSRTPCKLYNPPPPTTVFL